MKFEITLTVDVPEPMASSIPDEPQEQAEFMAVVDTAVERAVEAWIAHVSVRSTKVTLVANADGTGFESSDAPPVPLTSQH